MIPKEKKAEYNQKYRSTRREILRFKQKEYASKNPGVLVSYRLRNKERIAEKRKTYRENHREETRAYARKKYAEDTMFRIAVNMRCRFKEALRGGYKSGSVIRDLGCGIPELRNHLQEQFQPGMTWENYGYRGWHIDHIKPLSSFDLTNHADCAEALHYTNLQPLWAKDNLMKSNRTEEWRKK